MRTSSRFAVAVFLWFTVWPVTAGDFSNCYTEITPLPDLSKIVVIGRCTWKSSQGVEDTSVTIRGEMTVTPASTFTARDTCKGTPYCGMSLNPPYIASTTYNSSADFEASQWNVPFKNTTVTDTKTTPDPTNPHSTCPGCCEVSPILISTRGDYHLTSVADGVSFDIDADGVADRMSWTAAGSDVAFLALDRNRNGAIDNGAELFGDVVAANGWDALAELDANRDGVMNANDAAWRDLLLWYDRDHNGSSSVTELVPIASSNIIAIGTGYQWSGRRDPFGNMFRYAGQITLTHGRRDAYDVYFLAAN
jgi:hypothetical protein